MKIWIDTNVFIDYLADRKPYSDDAEKIILLGNTYFESHMSALSFANIAYIFRKESNAESLDVIYKHLSSYVSIESLTSEDIALALNMGFSDYEDALQTAGALKVGAEYIVTRNIKDYANSPIRAIEPRELIKNLLS